MLIKARSGISAISCPVDVVAQDIPLRLGQQILPLHKLVEQFRNVGRKVSLLQPLIPRPGIEELRQLIQLRDARGHPLSGPSACWNRFRLSVMGRTKSPGQEEGQGQQHQEQSQGRNDPGLLDAGCVGGIALLGDQDGNGPDGVLRFPSGDGYGLVQADIPSSACVVFVIVSPLMDGQSLLTVQVGAVDAAHQSIRQQQTAVLDRSQHSDGRSRTFPPGWDRKTGNTGR